MKPKQIETEFGRARLNKNGYYMLSSARRLHVVIWENHYGKSVPKGYVIHHIDGNKTNNSINNLQCVKRELHVKYHNKHKKYRNTSGYFRVTKLKRKRGYSWMYVYPEGDKRKTITRRTIPELKKAVEERGLVWVKK